MEILDEKDGVDTELLVYAMTLINKVSDLFRPSEAVHLHALSFIHFSTARSVSTLYFAFAG